MSKRKKQPQQQKKNKLEKICERCGNENFSYKPVYKCRFCGEINGLKKESE